MNEYEQIAHLLEQRKQTSKSKTFSALVESIVEQQMQTGGDNVENVAAELSITTSSFRRHCKAYLGLTPARFILFLRLRKSLSLMQSYPTVTLSNISSQCGFYDRAHFNHTFTRFFGQSPSAYIQQLQGGVNL